MMPPARPVAELLSHYHPQGDVEAADLERVLQLTTTTDDPWSQRLPLHLTASALVVHPPTGRVLLRWHARQQGWLQIGGHGDPGETEPIEIALREGLEETGLGDLRPWPDETLLHAVICQVPAKGTSPAHEHADLRFVLATEQPEAARAERQDAPVRWLDLPAAAALTAEDNLRETIRRVGLRLPAGGTVIAG
jgi:8-oxo-dGTP pyrophosphatase MutT (NUDIX family)